MMGVLYMENHNLCSDSSIVSVAKEERGDPHLSVTEVVYVTHTMYTRLILFPLDRLEVV